MQIGTATAFRSRVFPGSSPGWPTRVPPGIPRISMDSANKNHGCSRNKGLDILTTVKSHTDENA